LEGVDAERTAGQPTPGERRLSIAKVKARLDI
jgi:hypothetical protein